MALVILALLALVAAMAVAMVAANHVTRRRVPDEPASPADHGLAFEEVAFASRDGLTLRGWFIPAQPARGTVVFCHGHAGSMDPDVKYAPRFHDRGYNVLMFDFRAHGNSEGQHVSMGYFERLDLLGAMDYLQKRGIESVGVMGFSMGGAVAMSAAPQSQAIRAVVSDGGFARLVPAIAAGIRERGLPGWLAPLVVRFAGWRVGARLPEADPIEHVRAIAPRALLLIHGGADPYVSTADVQALYEAAGQPKELWIVPEAGHRQVERHRREEYWQRVLGFFDRWLGEEAEKRLGGDTE